jgi:hypothetical protein
MQPVSELDPFSPAPQLLPGAAKHWPALQWGRHEPPVIRLLEQTVLLSLNSHCEPFSYLSLLSAPSLTLLLTLDRDFYRACAMLTLPIKV